MVMSAAGTFDYTVVVPSASGNSWPAGSRSVPKLGDHVIHDRLVGQTPTVEITDAGLTPNPGWDEGTWRPCVSRSRVTISATTRKGASNSAAVLYVDRRLTAALKVGDALHLSRTQCCGLGISIVREGTLLAAVGAVTDVPLGTRLSAQYPMRVIEAAERVFQRGDPHFAFREVPVEVRVGSSCRFVSHGYATIEDYEVFGIHGFQPGIPGRDECIALWNRNLFSASAATSTAQLLQDRMIEFVKW